MAHIVLEADSDPERDTGDQAFAIVDPVLNDDSHTDDEEHRQQHGGDGRRPTRLDGRRRI